MESCENKAKNFLKCSANNVIEPSEREITELEKTEAWQKAKGIFGEYKKYEPELIRMFDDTGLGSVGNVSTRVKSEQSLHDKIINYLKENRDSTIDEACQSVRDAFGARTIIKNGKYTNIDDVKKLINEGKKEEAILRATELQSQPIFEALKKQILKEAKGTAELIIYRISNYVSDNGIPYFSEKQFRELKEFAYKNNVKFEYREKLSKTELNKIGATNYKPTTRSQPSGYTALQINFKDKNGRMIEWQFRGEKVNSFAEGEHIVYDLRTNKDIIGKYSELKIFLEPLKNILSEKNMPKNVYENYNKYLANYYIYLRKIELGFDESLPPILSDYQIEDFIFDNRLDGRNLKSIHNITNNLKNGKVSKNNAMLGYFYIKKGLFNE